MSRERSPSRPEPTLPLDPPFSFTRIGVVRIDDPRVDLGHLDADTVAHRTGRIEIEERFVEGLADIDGFSHLYVLFVFHRAGARPEHLVAHPPFETPPHGVFATRSPHRPNPIGLTIVRLLDRDGCCLKVSGLDMVDGTPVLDIKPYTARDRRDGVREGWLETARNTDGGGGTG